VSEGAHRRGPKAAHVMHRGDAPAHDQSGVRKTVSSRGTCTRDFVVTSLTCTRGRDSASSLQEAPHDTIDAHRCRISIGLSRATRDPGSRWVSEEDTLVLVKEGWER
jgi:hypothetical protein